MREGKLFEVRGTCTITVAKTIWARTAEEAMEIAEQLDIELTDYANGTIGVDDYSSPGDEAVCCADGYLKWNEADDWFCCSVEEMDDEDKEAFEEDYWEEEEEEDE